MSYVQFLCYWEVRPVSSSHRNGYRLSCQTAKLWSPADQNPSCPNDNFQCNKTGNLRINVTLQRVRVTTVVNKTKYYIFWVCVYSFRYPACNAHAPYCHLWPAPLHNIFPTLSHKRHDFRKKHKMCVLIFSTHFVWNISHSKNNLGRYYNIIINTRTSSCKYPSLLSDFNETWIFSIHFRKIRKFGFSWKSV
jgi:hypothetical protein